MAVSKTYSKLEDHLKHGEEILYIKEIPGFAGRVEHWLLTNQRLLLVKKNDLKEKLILYSGEVAIYHEIGESQFSGNVHLLTNQRVIVLDIGASKYILDEIPISRISKVDIGVIREGNLDSFSYGLYIHVIDNDGPVVIKHGGVIATGIDRRETDKNDYQHVNERFPRKICEVAGLSFAIPRKRIGTGSIAIVDFYSKSDLMWPARCSACYKSVKGLVYDEYAIKNPWLTAGYRLGPGLIPHFNYLIPYCPECYGERFGPMQSNRAVKAGGALSNGARVELSFENQAYMMEFIQVNRR